MKTKRRHELQTNQLADTLAVGIEKVKPYTRVILGVLLALVVLSCTYAFLAAQARGRQDQAWAEYISAMVRNPMTGEKNIKKLQDLADSSHKTTAGIWAKLALADIQAMDGNDTIFHDKAEGLSKLKDAVGLYEATLAESSEPMIRSSALFGLARSKESLGDLQAAAESYARLRSEYPESAYTTEALRREEALKRTNVREFYDWLAQYEPEKSAANLPGTPGERPDTSDKALDDSLKSEELTPFDKKFPLGGADKRDSERDEKAPAGSSDDDAKDAKPAAEQPAADKSAADKPDAAEQKPAATEEKPAVEKKSDADEEKSDTAEEKPKP